MTLSSGTRLGPYEILSPLGAGGMGEVYRARDPKLGREIAVKVLPGDVASDSARRQRFEQEARSASALNHPNILTIHDIAEADGTLYIAMELVDGKTLRELIVSGDPLPTRKLLDIAVQTADGLSKAHAAGIVHRDLKPENLMISRDGFVKILDFGLAKLTEVAAPDASILPTAIAAPTEPGTVMGTAGYMSPEQASGQPVDFRSDQFSFGSILYEMATGQRAFQRKTGAETLAAIIREEPEPIGQLAPRSPAPARWITERCLAKDPEERYVSTKDLARDLRSIRDHLSETSASGGMAAGEPARRRSRAIELALVGLGVVGAAFFAGVVFERRVAKVEPPTFHQLTFRRGPIWSARFGSDGKTILYSASWDGRPTEIFVSSPESPESKPFGLPGADILAVASTGEIAVLLGSHFSGPFTNGGTLARLSATGVGAPREVLEGVEFADWSPDGKELAVVRRVGDQRRLEYPIGKTLYETAGWIADPRVSRRDGRIAFIDHPVSDDDGGLVAFVDGSGRKTALTSLFSTARGLAWSPDGSEIWFTADEAGGNRALYAVSLSGQRRLLARVTGSMTIQDIAPDGRTLVAHGQETVGLVALAPGETKERDLSWLDWSLGNELSRDGKLVAFSETGEAGGADYSAYVRATDGSPAVRLGEGGIVALSPDAKWALTLLHSTAEAQLVLYPVGAGQPKPVPLPGLKVVNATFLPDGRHFLAAAAEEGHRSRIYLVDLEGGKPRALTAEGCIAIARIPNDGKQFVTRCSDGKTSEMKTYVYSIEGREPIPVSGLAPNDFVIGWTNQAGTVYVRRGMIPSPAHIDRLDITTGRTEPWKDLAPSDTAGITQTYIVGILPDGKAYAYSYTRLLSSLYLVKGLK
jgi:Tol biopolymer transport system component